jgi:hypothetical protein
MPTRRKLRRSRRKLRRSLRRNRRRNRRRRHKIGESDDEIGHETELQRSDRYRRAIERHIDSIERGKGEKLERYIVSKPDVLDRMNAIQKERERDARILGKDYWEIEVPEIYEEMDRNLYDDISEFLGYETENMREKRLRKERDREREIERARLREIKRQREIERARLQEAERQRLNTERKKEELLAQKVVEGDTQEVQILLNEGVEPNFVDFKIAITNEYTDIVRLFLERDVYRNAAAWRQREFIRLAIREGHANIERLLLQEDGRDNEVIDDRFKVRDLLIRLNREPGVYEFEDLAGNSHFINIFEQIKSKYSGKRESVYKRIKRVFGKSINIYRQCYPDLGTLIPDHLSPGRDYSDHECDDETDLVDVTDAFKKNVSMEDYYTTEYETGDKLILNIPGMLAKFYAPIYNFTIMYPIKK